MATKVKNEDRKQRNLVNSSDNEQQFQSFSCKFTPPYSDRAAMTEKLRIDNILGEHPFGRTSHFSNENHDETNNINFNLHLLNCSKNNSINNYDSKINKEYQDNFEKLTLDDIFKTMQIKPLLNKINEWCAKKRIMQMEFNLSEEELQEHESDKEELEDKNKINRKVFNRNSPDLIYDEPLVEKKLPFSSDSHSSDTFSKSPIVTSSVDSPKINSSPESSISINKEEVDPIEASNFKNSFRPKLNFNGSTPSKQSIVTKQDKKLLNLKKTTNEPILLNNSDNNSEEPTSSSFKFTLDEDDLEEDVSESFDDIKKENSIKCQIEVTDKVESRHNRNHTLFSDEENANAEIIENMINVPHSINETSPKYIRTPADDILVDKNSPLQTFLENKIENHLNTKNSLNKRIKIDQNGKPILIVSIELDLLKYCSQHFSIGKANSEYKKNSKQLEYEGEKRNERNILLTEDIQDIDDSKKNKELTIISHQKRISPHDESINIKKPKYTTFDDTKISNETKNDEKSSFESSNSSKIKQITTSKFSSTSGNINPTAIVKPISISKPLAQSNSKTNLKQKLGPKFDFLENELSFEVFHKRGITKKHEADNERDFPIKKITLYMEAVCNFCLCAITQHRLKKTKSMKPIELLNQTWKLLKHVNEKYVTDTLNSKYPDFAKKFKVLSNWMESFIFHWLWRINFNECKKLSTSLNELLQNLNTSNTTPNSMRNNTSPVEIPQSPNSVCSAESHNGCHLNESRSSSQPTELNLLRELHSKTKTYVIINDYNIRSQSKWDFNEWSINGDRQLQDFRETIEAQVQFRLSLYREVEDFASSVMSGLQLLQLNT